ncbi:hypothetical protein NP554_02410 [Pseudomonas asiatica]|uniref:Uncharacterized protein n=1 Tax=Pseudomonas asiatica TaxID=2219225 RepID=A0A9X4D704_9PSED|nr:hypothetical protein [Pseudomonas asiatica]MDD2110655.1 hypothetical protein [Pseudomonas asiatica]
MSYTESFTAALSELRGLRLPEDIERHATTLLQSIEHAAIALQNGGAERPLWESKGRATGYALGLKDGHRLDGSACARLTEVFRSYVEAVEEVPH